MSPLVALVGPTATGKTATAIRLAERLGGEIVSADSMAVYRGLDIGTAKPDAGERQQAAFHLIDVADLDQPFSVARFKDLADAAIAGIRERGRQPIICGGTGLYIRVLLEDFGLTETPADDSIRLRLDTEAAERGAPALHARLAEVDPPAAARIHPNDRIRTVRALEVFERTGVPMSVQQAEDARRRTPRPAHRFALTVSRDELYRRIDARVDAMIAAGLEEEVRRLLDAGYSPALHPLRSLGYKEMIAYLHGDMTREQAIDAIKQNTRRFAKRQLTWFRAEPGLSWIDVSSSAPEEVAEEVLERLPA